MPTPVRIDLVVDPSCPYCALAANSLVRAIQLVGDEASPSLYVQPYQINPDIGPEGMFAVPNAAMQFGAIEADAVNALSDDRGVKVNPAAQARFWNTADANRLLYWAGVESQQALNLLLAYFRANFNDRRSLSDHAVLIDCARSVGLDADRARSILKSKELEADTRAKERSAFEMGVSVVPTIILDQRWVVIGAKPPKSYAQSIRDTISGEMARLATRD